MKTKTIIFCVLFLANVLQLHSQGYIVPNGVVYSGFNSSFGYEVDVMHDVANSGYTRFFLDPSGKTQPTVYTNTFLFNEFLDVGVRVFLVSSNDAISLQAIQSQSFTELFFPSNYVFQSGVPFYLGLYTGYNFAPPYPPSPPYTYTEPVFGWVQLINNQGVIQMLGGALEYQGAGIYAGTQTIIPVPEPSTFALAAFGTLLVGFGRWRNKSR